MMLTLLNRLFHLLWDLTSYSFDGSGDLLAWKHLAWCMVFSNVWLSLFWTCCFHQGSCRGLGHCRIHEVLFRRLQQGGRSEKHLVDGILAGACGLVVVFPEEAMLDLSHPFR